MSGGIDWDDVSRPLMEDIHPLMALPLALYVAISLFIMMNLVTGIFVEAAQHNMQESKCLRLVHQLRDLFMGADTDHTGDISFEEFSKQLDNPLIEEYFEEIELAAHEAKHFFALLDLGNEGKINAEEFVNGCMRMRGYSRAIDLELLKSLMLKYISHTERIANYVEEHVINRSHSPAQQVTPKMANRTDVDATGTYQLCSSSPTAPLNTEWGPISSIGTESNLPSQKFLGQERAPVPAPPGCVEGDVRSPRETDSVTAVFERVKRISDMALETTSNDWKTAPSHTNACEEAYESSSNAIEEVQ
jgi:hypothetical protein